VREDPGTERRGWNAPVSTEDDVLDQVLWRLLDSCRGLTGRPFSGSGSGRLELQLLAGLLLGRSTRSGRLLPLILLFLFLPFSSGGVLVLRLSLAVLLGRGRSLLRRLGDVLELGLRGLSCAGL